MALPCSVQANVTCGDATIGYVALVTTDGGSYWNVSGNSTRQHAGQHALQSSELLCKAGALCMPPRLGSGGLRTGAESI